MQTTRQTIETMYKVQATMFHLSKRKQPPFVCELSIPQRKEVVKSFEEEIFQTGGTILKIHLEFKKKREFTSGFGEFTFSKMLKINKCYTNKE